MSSVKKKKPNTKPRKSQYANKPRLRKQELNKRVSKRSGYHFYEVQDVLNAYYDVIFEAIVSGEEVHIPGVGRLWIIDPRPHRYFDVHERQVLDTVTYPVVAFKATKDFRKDLRAQEIREIKKEVRMQSLEPILKEQDREFDEVFKTKKDPVKESSSK